MSSSKNLQKLKYDIQRARHSKSKDKDAKIKKIAAAIAKENTIASEAKVAKLTAASAADHANVSIATAKYTIPPKKGQEATRPNPGPPKTHGPRIYFLKSEKGGKRVKILKDLLDMKPKMRVDACIKVECFVTGPYKAKR